MPNAATHIKGAIFAGAIATAALLQVHVPLFDSAMIGGSIVLSELFLSPDLDLNSGSASYRRWGIFQWFWKPYQLAIGHRSVLSHSGPLSFTLRFFYLLFPLLMLASLTKSPLDSYYPAMVLFWLGGCVSDTMHTLLDKTRIK